MIWQNGPPFKQISIQGDRTHSRGHTKGPGLWFQPRSGLPEATAVIPPHRLPGHTCGHGYSANHKNGKIIGTRVDHFDNSFTYPHSSHFHTHRLSCVRSQCKTLRANPWPRCRAAPSSSVIPQTWSAVESGRLYVIWHNTKWYGRKYICKICDPSFQWAAGVSWHCGVFFPLGGCFSDHCWRNWGRFDQVLRFCLRRRLCSVRQGSTY